MKEENDTVLAATKDHVALELRTLGFVHSISRSVESVAETELFVMKILT